MRPPEPRLELRGIDKRFGPVQALHGADFTLGAGEVHALLGENGAGKTTLMHVAYGLVQPDAGDVKVAGLGVAPDSPRAGRRAGIGMVHQHFTSIPALTVSENVALEAGWSPRPRALRLRVSALVERLGLPLDPDARAEDLPAALLQRLEIVKALAGGAGVLLLDEPTAMLAPGEADELLRVVRRFADQGGAAVVITHKLREALAVADRVTVLRRGRVVLSAAAATQTPDSLAAAMIGGEEHGPTAEATVGTTRSAAPAVPHAGERTVHIRASRASVVGRPGELAVRDATFEIRAGELVGIAAVEGNGQRELLRAVAGLQRIESGSLDVAAPVGFIAEDRTTEGLIPELPLTDNYVLGTLGRMPFADGPHIDWREARRRTAALITAAEVRAVGPGVRADTLSGGNQQKFVVARALALDPRVLVAENPTRGLDLRATAGVHAQLRAAAGRGTTVLLHSTDLDEVLALATRVLVVSRGHVRSADPGAGRDTIGRMMLGAGE